MRYLTWIALSAVAAFAQSPASAAPAESSVRVIVQFKQHPTVTVHRKVAKLGGKLVRELGVIDGAAYTIAPSRVKELSALSEVKHVSIDSDLSASKPPSPPARPGHDSPDQGEQ